METSPSKPSFFVMLKRIFTPHLLAVLVCLPDKRYLPKTFFINHSSAKPPSPVLPEAGAFCPFLGGKKRKTGSSDVKDDGTVVFGDDLRYYKIVEVYPPADRRTYL